MYLILLLLNECTTPDNADLVSRLSLLRQKREGEPANEVETLQLGHIFAVEFVWQTATRKGKKVAWFKHATSVSSHCQAFITFSRFNILCSYVVFVACFSNRSHFHMHMAREGQYQLVVVAGRPGGGGLPYKKDGYTCWNS